MPVSCLFSFRFLTLFLLFALLSVPVSAQTPCKNRNPGVYFESNIRNVKYVRTDSVEDLTGWQSAHGILGTKVLGVGGGQIGTKLKVLYEMVEQGDDLYCLYPKQIKADFYASPKIHIASNFPRGSCEYSEVLVHEQKHIAVLRKFHREYKSDYAEEFRKIVRNLPRSYPIKLEDAAEEKKKTTGFIMGGLNDYTKIMMDDLNRRQRAIDTEEEYDRVIAKCSNWNQKITKKQ